MDEKKKKAVPQPFYLWAVSHSPVVQYQHFCRKQHKPLVFLQELRYNTLMRQLSKLQMYGISSPLLHLCCYQNLNGTWIFEAHGSKSYSFNLLSERHSFPLKNWNNRDQHLHGFSLHFLICISPESQIIQQLLTLPLRILTTLPTSKSIRLQWLFLLSF